MLDWKSEQAEGEWLGGDTAESIRVTLVAGPQQLVVARADGSVVARWPIASIRIDTLHNGNVAHLESATEPDRLATTSDTAFVAKLCARGARASGLPRGGRAFVVGLGCLAGVIAIFSGLYAAAPWLSRRAAERIPLSIEQRLDSQIGELFVAYACETPESRRALDALKARLDPKGASPATVHITNVQTPNAFALPGGDVLMTRGLLEEAESADEIAGVLAHELAHVQHRHVLAELIEKTFLGSVWALTIGDYSGLLIVDPKTLYEVLTLSHSREAEQEADATGAALLRTAGVSTAGLIAFLRRNSSTVGDKMSFLSTHPASAERIAFLSIGLAQDTVPALNEADYRALKDACADQPKGPSLSDLLD